MQKDVTEHCLACQRIKGNRSHSYHQGSTADEIPFQRVALDYWGSLPTSTRGNKYILVALDTYTRLLEHYPTQSINQHELATAFYDKFILRHGVPNEILSDNGAPFNTLFNTQITKLIGAESLFTPAYHPSANGAVERFMKSAEHDPHIHQQRNNYRQLEPASTHHTVRIQHNVDQLKVNTNQLNQVNPYKIGDLVLVYNQAHTTKNKPHKLAFDWYGPLMVRSLISKSSCNLKYQESCKTLKNVHVSRMKKYHANPSNT
ncbi:hypothetical protein [Absidia glauca]|uniref:Integrase catalytic domain-containing protein n=1 Tax=Absidia glauca TaxID=4829 RepID=A0A168RFQ3_ABSGL|nr:hypothetical protein [Absidia glauca]